MRRTTCSPTFLCHAHCTLYEGLPITSVHTLELIPRIQAFAATRALISPPCAAYTSDTWHPSATRGADQPPWEGPQTRQAPWFQRYSPRSSPPAPLTTENRTESCSEAAPASMPNLQTKVSTPYFREATFQVSTTAPVGRPPPNLRTKLV